MAAFHSCLMTSVIVAHGNRPHTGGASRAAREDGDFLIYFRLVAQHLAFVCVPTSELSSWEKHYKVSSLQLRMVASRAMLPLSYSEYS